MPAMRLLIGVSLALILGSAVSASAEPPRPTHVAAQRNVQLAQMVRETPLDELDAVDRGRIGATRRSEPPPPPPVPPVPQADSRSAPGSSIERGPTVGTVPPPGARYDSSASARTPPEHLHPRVAVPPPRQARLAPPPPRYSEPPPQRYSEPPPRRYSEPPPRRAPVQSSFYSRCTQQCHLSCDAAFEACNGDASPANPACVRKLESCRLDRCDCRMQ
jgi:hypothetical protein